MRPAGCSTESDCGGRPWLQPGCRSGLRPVPRAGGGGGGGGRGGGGGGAGGRAGAVGGGGGGGGRSPRRRGLPRGPAGWRSPRRRVPARSGRGKLTGASARWTARRR